MSDAEKDEAIKKVYTAASGFGASMYNTFKDAKVLIPSITHSYVKDWFKRNIERTTQEGKGKHSWVAPRSKREYQADIFFITEMQLKNQQYPYGMSVVDVFSKYATVIPMERKTAE